MSLWIRNGSIVSTRGGSALVDCDECPCGGGAYSCLDTSIRVAFAPPEPDYCQVTIRLRYANATIYGPDPFAVAFAGASYNCYNPYATLTQAQGDVEVVIQFDAYQNDGYSALTLHAEETGSGFSAPSLVAVEFSPSYVERTDFQMQHVSCSDEEDFE